MSEQKESIIDLYRQIHILVDYTPCYTEKLPPWPHSFLVFKVDKYIDLTVTYIYINFTDKRNNSKLMVRKINIKTNFFSSYVSWQHFKQIQTRQSSFVATLN